MDRELSISKARENFSELVEQVQHRGGAIIISRHGKPAAAIVPVEVYESWKRERQAFFDLIRQVQRKADLTTEEAQRLAYQAGAAARAQGESIL